MQYVVIIEETQNGGYSAYVPDLPVCFTVGDTLTEVQTHIKDAIDTYLDEVREMDMLIPPSGTLAMLVPV